MLAEEQYHEHIIGMEQVTWRPPVPSPGKICGVAMNNSASNERKNLRAGTPGIFPEACFLPGRASTTHTHPPLLRQRASGAGNCRSSSVRRPGIFLPQMRWMPCSVTVSLMILPVTACAPKTCLNTGRCMQKRITRMRRSASGKHLSYAGRYKGCDTFGCSGPWVVTQDEIENPDELNVFCKNRG